MKILISGSREYEDYETFEKLLFDILDKEKLSSPDWVITPKLTIIHGECRGIDKLAQRFCIKEDHNEEPYPAQWNKYGDAAGPLRNQQMIDEGKPDLVLAFPCKKSTGTYDLIRKAKEAKVKTIVTKLL